MEINNKDLSTGELAQRFVDATIDRPGTDEQAVYAILEEVHKRGVKDEFAGHLTTHDSLKQMVGSALPRNLVPKILQDEMSGTELTKSLDIWRDGKPSYSDSGFESLLQGAMNRVADMGETFYEHPVLATAATVVGGGVLAAGVAAAVPAVVVGGALLFAGAAGYGAGTTAYHGVKATLAESPKEKAEHLEKAGGAFVDTALAAAGAISMAVPATKSLEAINTARAVGGKNASLISNLFTPGKKIADKTALQVLSQFKGEIAKGKKAQGNALETFIGKAWRTGKGLKETQQKVLRNVVADKAWNAEVRRDALMALDRSGAIKLGGNGGDISMIEKILLEKTSNRATMATDQDAALLFDYAVSLLKGSKDPRAIELMRAAYWKNAQEIEKVTGHKVSHPVINDLSAAITDIDPLFPMEKNLVAIGIGPERADPGILTSGMQKSYYALLKKEKGALANALKNLAEDRAVPDYVGRNLYDIHKVVTEGIESVGYKTSGWRGFFADTRNVVNSAK